MVTTLMANPVYNSVMDTSAEPTIHGAAGQGEDAGGEIRRHPLAQAQTTDGPGLPSLPEHWLTLHGDALFRYALLLVADEHQAEDLVQEALLAALEGRRRFTAGASERTWLIAILRHKAIDERRRGRRHDQYLAAADPVVDGNFNRFGKWRKPPRQWTPNPLSMLETKEFWAVFQSCMHSLPAAMREAFALRIIEGLDATETCRMLEITSANLWTTLYRARERLRRCLEGKWFVKEEP
jgi:RNA polymerase sigma-70 factor (TIGR02943 family)